MTLAEIPDLQDKFQKMGILALVEEQIEANSKHSPSTLFQEVLKQEISQKSQAEIMEPPTQLGILSSLEIPAVSYSMFSSDCLYQYMVPTSHVEYTVPFGGTYKEEEFRAVSLFGPYPQYDFKKNYEGFREIVVQNLDVPVLGDLTHNVNTMRLWRYKEDPSDEVYRD